MQVRVVAYDSATPKQRASAVVYVTVKRNENKPLFKDDSYSASINTTYPQGLLILQVKAADKDSQVSHLLHSLSHVTRSCISRSTNHES